MFDTLVNDFFNGSVLLDTTTFNSNMEISLSVTDSNGDLIGSSSYVMPERASSNGTDSQLDIEWTNKNQWLYSDSLIQKVYVCCIFWILSLKVLPNFYPKIFIP